jgi:predicted secreted hydrolase
MGEKIGEIPLFRKMGTFSFSHWRLRKGECPHFPKKRNVPYFLLSVLCLFTSASHAAVTYPPVIAGTELRFPRDEGSHPQYRLEWWYVTGQVHDERNRERGFQVTFFRVRTGIAESNRSRFAPRQVLFAHAAIADPQFGRLRHAERSAREGFGLAQAREGVVDVRLDDWSLRQSVDGRYHAVVAGPDFSFALDLKSTQPLLLQGERGYSRKGPDPRAASYYYSQPQLTVGGEMVIDGRRQQVSGTAWLDHEWSSDYVDASAQGWDWAGINLDDGGALMVFRMRDPQGGERWASATLRSAGGRVQVFESRDVEWVPGRKWRSPRTGVEYPVQWRVRVGNRTYEIEPSMPDAELDSRSSTGTIYWEGPVNLRLPGGARVGRGYLEMTGYAGKMEM